MRRRTLWGLVALLGAVIGYVAFALLYAVGLPSQSDFTPAAPPVGGIDVDVIPQSFDPLSETVTVIIRVDADRSFYGANGTLERPIELAISPLLDQDVFIFAKGSPDMAVTGRIEVEGSVRTYPFDVHRTHITARATELDAEGRPIGGPLPMRANLQVADGFTQWEVGGSTQVPDNITTAADVRLSFSRSATTVVAAVMMVALMLTLGIVVLLVMWWVVTKRRDVEFGMVTWFAALTFALITVRNNLPGSPPIGAWVDVLVFFWVQFSLLLALVVCMSVWLRAHRNGDVTGADTRDAGSEEDSRGSSAPRA